MRSTQGNNLTNWQVQSVQCIEIGLSDYKAQQASSEEAIDRQKCKKWISLNKYPFGARENHPYAVWNKEIKILDEFLSFGIAFCQYKGWRKAYKKTRKPIQRNQESADENQLTLF